MKPVPESLRKWIEPGDYERAWAEEALEAVRRLQGEAQRVGPAD